MKQKLIVTGMLCAVLGACASEPKPTVASAPKSATPINLASIEAGQRGLGSIGDASLPDKSCGMVLWTLEGTRPAAVFKFVSGKEAHINIAGQPVSLQRTDYSGAVGFGVYERQVFANADGIEVEISTRFGLEFSDGAYLEQGLVKVRDRSGWSMVAPAAGIAGCRK